MKTASLRAAIASTWLLSILSLSGTAIAETVVPEFDPPAPAADTVYPQLEQAVPTDKSKEKFVWPDSHLSFEQQSRELEKRVKLPVYTGNFSQCIEQIPHGTPPSLPKTLAIGTRALCFSEHAVMYSSAYHAPLYSVQRLDRNMNTQVTPRLTISFEDLRLPLAERAVVLDYRDSAYAPVQMTAAVDLSPGHPMAESFTLSNIAPMVVRRAWDDVERATRRYVRSARGHVYVFTGPVYDQEAICPIVAQAQERIRAMGRKTAEMAGTQLVELARSSGAPMPKVYDLDRCTIGNGLRVPTHFYKLVYDISSGRAWAYWLPNVDSARSAAQTIDYLTLVKKTGIQFIPAIALASQ